ncbi:hypothetical protein CLOP_g12992 [Closterium sp. NIES-67]|nr:hypothetical protein CLOP_g12992 [Closterium sp. NIES-67]
MVAATITNPPPPVPSPPRFPRTTIWEARRTESAFGKVVSQFLPHRLVSLPRARYSRLVTVSRANDPHLTVVLG